MNNKMLLCIHSCLILPSVTALFVDGSGSKMWEVPMFTSSANLSESLHWEQNCQYRHLQDRVKITADIPPRVDGTWVSTRYLIKIEKP